MGVLARWGRLVGRHPWRVLIGCLVLFLLTVVSVASGGSYASHTLPEGLESTRAVDLMNRELPGRPPTFQLVMTSRRWKVQDPRFRAAVHRALARLRADPRVAAVHTGYESPRLVSRDGHALLVNVELKGRIHAGSTDTDDEAAVESYPELRAEVTSDELEVLPAGALAMRQELHDALHADLRRADLVVLPIVLVMLLLVFGALVAALLPLVVGVLAVLGGIAGTLLLSRFMPVSPFAVNIVTMIGLGVAIDYSLFFVDRFREELQAHDLEEALVRTTEAAGRVVLFSGATVVIGLLAMLRVPVGGIASMGLAGVVVVAFSLVYELTFLMPVLALLGPRIDMGRLPFLRRGGAEGGLWKRLAMLVMRHPWGIVVPVTVLLLFLGTPVARMHVANDPAAALPADAEARRGEQLARTAFPGGNVTRIPVVFHYPAGSPVTAERLHEIGQWSARVRKASPTVEIQSALDEPAMRGRVRGPHVATLQVSTRAPADSEQARSLVETLRAVPPPPGAEVLVTGDTAFDVDFIEVVRAYAPWVVGSVLAATYVLLFLLLGSALLPLKAVMMNLLSITASYGALVWVFQEGHLSGWLHFAPAPIEPLSPLIMFCVLFGLSMDYEVLLLSRTREEYRRTHDNSEAVALALQRTGRLITGAAAIMAVVFFGFGVSQTMVVKSMGIGMGIAVVVDATIIRALLVPAAMQLLGRWNWWAPSGLKQLHRRIGLGRLSMRGG